MYVREVRIHFGRNQTDFWRALSVTQSGGSRYEAGRTIPGPLKLLLSMAVTDDEKSAIEELKRIRKMIRNSEP